MEELTLDKFNPTVAELKKRVGESKRITVTDLKNEAQMEAVKTSRKELRGYEIDIEKTGKAYRNDALAYQRAVITKEKELKAITSPEIARLKTLEEDSKALILKEERLEDLPRKKEKLSKIGDKIKISDDELLEMDYDQFMVYHNQRVADKLDVDRKVIDDKRIALEQKEKEAELVEKAKKQAEDDLNKKQKEKEDEEKKETVRLAKLKKFQAFLKEYNYNEEDFVKIDKGDRVVIYKKVAEFIKE